MNNTKAGYFETYKFRKILALILTISSIFLIIFLWIWVRTFIEYRDAELKFWNYKKSNAKDQQKVFFGISILILVFLSMVFFLTLFITLSFIRGARNGYVPLRIITWLFIIIIIGSIILISFIPNNQIKGVVDPTTGQKIVQILKRPNYIYGWTILGLSIVFAVLCSVARRTFGYVKNDIILSKKDYSMKEDYDYKKN